MKKVFSIALSLVFAIGCIFTTMAAESQPIYEGGGAIPGVAPSQQEQVNKAKTLKGQSFVQEKQALNDAANSGISTFAAVSAYNIPSMTYYGQEGSWWCVPAAVKMVMKKVDGVTLTQTSLASAMGTSNTTGTPFFSALDYLVENCWNWWYEGRNRSTSTIMKDEVALAVSNDSPSVLCVKFTTSGGWPYNMSSYHAVLATGYTTDYASYRIHDPYIKPYVNSSHTGNYTVTFTNVYNATHSYLW